MRGVEFPLIILGGSDRRPGVLPPTGEGKHPLSGYKGVDIRIGGRPIVALLVERLRTCPEFDPIVVAGPRRVYAAVDPPVDVIDTDGNVARNVEVAIDWARKNFPGRRVALTACDILPDPGELHCVLEDYRQSPQCPAWYPLVRAPREPGGLAAFAWKPSYSIVPERGREAVRVLPGHLGILHPDSLRLSVIFRALRVAYETRNRPIGTRRWTMLRRALLSLLMADGLGLLRMRAPLVTWTVVAQALRAGRKLQGGKLLRSELEEALTRISVRRRLVRRDPTFRVRVPISDALGLARDVDTEEEAREIADSWES